jgi:hypothetical protein
MATPQESITTVNGRRCTRSRARTAATSTSTSTTTEATVVTPTEFTTSTAVEQASQIQTSTESAPPSPPPVPESSTTTSTEQTVAAPTTETVATSAIGTISAVPTTSSVRITPLPTRAPSAPAALVPVRAPEPKGPEPEPSQTIVVTSAPPTDPAPTSSDTLPIADSSSLATSIRGPLFTAPAASAAPSSVEPNPEQPSQSDAQLQPIPTGTSVPVQPQPATSALATLPSGDSSAGIIAPEQGGPEDSPLTLPGNGDANIGSIVGGVIGGVACLALISGLLFFCLRKRKTNPVRWNEKRVAGPGFMEKVKSIPAGVGLFIAKIKGKKAGSFDNPYQRHTVQSSVGSVYSTNTSGRVRSMSEPQGLFAGKRSNSVRSTSSKKSERNLLRKKQSSMSSDYRFPGIAEDIITQDDKMDLNPFTDPEPPRTLALLNPDPNSAPVTPLVPAATADRAPRNPFALSFDKPGDLTDARRPPIPFHRRNLSSVSALSSHPPSMSLPMENPFQDPAAAPSAPTPAVVPAQTRPPLNAFPSFNTISTPSTGASRDSNYTFFGEPGPSRPGTNLFTPGLPTGRTVRQSDPFDLDRPEVLGFGDVLGRKEVGASVTRQGTASKRTSSVGNWISGTAGSFGSYGPYERDSAKPRPLWSANNQR